MFRIAPDDGLDEGGFPHARRTDNSDNGGRRLGWEAVDLGNMEAFLFDLASLSMEINKKRATPSTYIMGARGLLLQFAWFGVGECFGVPVYATLVRVTGRIISSFLTPIMLLLDLRLAMRSIRLVLHAANSESSIATTKFHSKI